MNDTDLIHTITNGKGTMPGAGDVLTAHEIRAVAAFLRVLSPGYELYDRFCACCHG
jgi:mono/diheme cytochrome c family protein